VIGADRQKAVRYAWEEYEGKTPVDVSGALFREI